MGNDLEEASLEGLELLLAMLVEDKVYQQVGILMLVLLVDKSLRAFRDELMDLGFPKDLHLNCEWLVELFFQVSILTLQDIVQARCYFRLILFQILDCRLDIQ